MSFAGHVYLPSPADRASDLARLEDARELVDAVRADLPRQGAMWDRADAASHEITELMRSLRR